jgi:hypothetical protein
MTQPPAKTSSLAQQAIASIKGSNADLVMVAAEETRYIPICRCARQCADAAALPRYKDGKQNLY